MNLHRLHRFIASSPSSSQNPLEATAPFQGTRSSLKRDPQVLDVPEEATHKSLLLGEISTPCATIHHKTIANKILPLNTLWLLFKCSQRFDACHPLFLHFLLRSTTIEPDISMTLSASPFVTLRSTCLTRHSVFVL